MYTNILMQYPCENNLHPSLIRLDNVTDDQQRTICNRSPLVFPFVFPFLLIRLLFPAAHRPLFAVGLFGIMLYYTAQKETPADDATSRHGRKAPAPVFISKSVFKNQPALSYPLQPSHLPLRPDL